jgi:hypothetical protein
MCDVGHFNDDSRVASERFEWAKEITATLHRINKCRTALSPDIYRGGIS